MFNLFKKSTKEKLSGNLLSAQKAGFDIGEATHFLNPCWGIKVTHNGQTLIDMPFSFLVHTHLKDYGFKPDSLTKNSPKVHLILKEGSSATIELFLDKTKFEKAKK